MYLSGDRVVNWHQGVRFRNGERVLPAEDRSHEKNEIMERKFFHGGEPCLADGSSYLSSSVSRSGLT
jgi:hypothetical protein